LDVGVPLILGESGGNDWEVVEGVRRGDGGHKLRRMEKRTGGQAIGRRKRENEDGREM